MIRLYYPAFMLIGIAAGLLGTSLAFLIERFAIPPDQGGIFITLFTIGTTFGTFFVGRLLDRLNARAVAWIGPLLLGIGSLVISAAVTTPAALLAMPLYGVGFGALLVCGNVLIARVSAPHSAPALNLLSLCFAIGGILGPEIATSIIVRSNVMTAYAVFGFTALILFPFMLLVNVMPPAPVTNGSGGASRTPWTPFLLFAAFFIIYTGAELGFTSWIYTQMFNVARLPVQEAARAVSVFWIGMMIGRLLAIPLTRRISDEWILIADSLLLMLTIITLLTFATNPIISMITVGLFGLFAGPIFSSALAMVGRRFPDSAGRISGALLAVGNIGIAIVPFIQGKVGRGVDGGYSVTLIMTILLLIMAVLLSRHTRAFTAAARS